MRDDERLMWRLQNTDWGENADLVRYFLASPHAKIMQEAVRGLNQGALYASYVYGPGTIVRAMCHGAMGAWKSCCSEHDTQLLMAACAYHDVGRVNDFPDPEHGQRSADYLGELTGIKGDELTELCAVVAAHSRPDEDLQLILRHYGVRNKGRATMLTKLLKDAVALSQVQFGGSDLSSFQTETEKRRIAFAFKLASVFNL